MGSDYEIGGVAPMDEDSCMDQAGSGSNNSTDQGTGSGMGADAWDMEMEDPDSDRQPDSKKKETGLLVRERVYA